MAVTREVYRAHLRKRLRQCDVPISLHEGLTEYLVQRRPTGRFLESVLRNDLQGAATRADVVTRGYLFEIVCFLTNYAPATSWGSPAAVDTWLADPTDPPALFE